MANNTCIHFILPVEYHDSQCRKPSVDQKKYWYHACIICPFENDFLSIRWVRQLSVEKVSKVYLKPDWN